MTTTLATSLLQSLHQADITHLFLVPGNTIDPLVRTLATTGAPRPILALHEFSAGCMADGYARASGRWGVALAIGGPGAGNLVSPATTARGDGSPVLFITGNLPRPLQEQGAFQDGGPRGSNDSAVLQAATGCSLSCADGTSWPETWRQAEARLRQGLPVHVMVARDVQEDPVPPPLPCPPLPAAAPPPRAWLARQRPLLVAGAGCIDQAPALRAWVRRHQVPVATDSHGRGIIPETWPEALGPLGFLSHPRALAALDPTSPLAAEAIILAGVTGALPRVLRQGGIPCHTVAPAALLALDAPAADLEPRRAWLRELATVTREPGRACGLTHRGLIALLAAHLPPDTAYVVDAGQLRRAAAVMLTCQNPRTLFMAPAQAPMGWSLGATIGVKLALPQRPVVALIGDGAMAMHGPELATACRYHLPILFVVADNRAYATLLQRYQDTPLAEMARLPPVDWPAFARALGVTARQVSNREELEAGLISWRAGDGPHLLAVSLPEVEAEPFPDDEVYR